MNFVFGAREADSDVPPIVTAADTLKSAISDFLEAFNNTNGLEQRYPVSSTDLAAVPAMLDQIVDEFAPGHSTDAMSDLDESARYNRSDLFVPRFLD